MRGSFPGLSAFPRKGTFLTVSFERVSRAYRTARFECQTRQLSSDGSGDRPSLMASPVPSHPHPHISAPPVLSFLLPFILQLPLGPTLTPSPHEKESGSSGVLSDSVVSSSCCPGGPWVQSPGSLRLPLCAGCFGLNTSPDWTEESREAHFPYLQCGFISERALSSSPVSLNSRGRPLEALPRPPPAAPRTQQILSVFQV